MDKAQINKIVKKIKEIRSQNVEDEKETNFKLQVSSKPEKIIIGASLAAALAIVFDDSKKRAKNPTKAKPFHKRWYSNYKKLDSFLDNTIAQQLKKDSEREFNDDKLEAMEIENGLEFKL